MTNFLKFSFYLFFNLNFDFGLPRRFTPLVIREGEGVTGMDTFTDISLLQPHSLFSITVYLYLLFRLYTFTTTLYQVPLLFHNRKRSSVLMGLRFQVLSYTLYKQPLDLNSTPSKPTLTLAFPAMNWISTLHCILPPTIS